MKLKKKSNKINLIFKNIHRIFVKNLIVEGYKTICLSLRTENGFKNIQRSTNKGVHMGRGYLPLDFVILHRNK